MQYVKFTWIIHIQLWFELVLWHIFKKLSILNTNSLYKWQTPLEVMRFLFFWLLKLLVTDLIVNQESLWRHGVVHDPAKQKLKVKCPCRVFFFFFFFVSCTVVSVCSSFRNCALKRICPGVRPCRPDWQLKPIRARPTSLLQGCAKQL